MSYTDAALLDKVSSLPGFASLNSNVFSGYLAAATGKYIHYIYVESENDPSTDPVTFWTNGGPGCSGLLGLFTEMGTWRPYAVNGNESNIQLMENPYAWTKLTSMVYLEQPAGVGFSYVTSDAVLNYGDKGAINDMLIAMDSFYEKFPERMSNILYISSESYGGHYMPELSLKMLNSTDKFYIQHNLFRGILVGNPYVSFGSGEIAGANALWGLQLVSKALWNNFTNASCDDLDSSAFTYSEYCWDTLMQLDAEVNRLNPSNSSTAAAGHTIQRKKKLLKSSSAQARTISKIKHALLKLATHSSAVNQYVLLGGTEGLEMSMSDEIQVISVDDHRLMVDEMKARYMSSKGAIADEDGDDENAHVFRQAIIWDDYNAEEDDYSPPAASGPFIAPTGLLLYDPCAEKYTADYLNRADVQQALHIVNSPIAWGECNDAIFENWPVNDMFGDTIGLYADLYSKLETNTSVAAATDSSLYPNFKLLVFSGDADGVCATVGTQHWVYNITNGTKPSNETLWIPWYIQDQLAGYQTILDSSFVSFVTVHHAGHEVPGYQPERALALYYGFLTGSIFNTSFAHSSEALFAVPEMSQSTSTQPLTSELWFWAAVGGGLLLVLVAFWLSRYFKDSLFLIPDHIPLADVQDSPSRSNGEESSVDDGKNSSMSILLDSSTTTLLQSKEGLEMTEITSALHQSQL